MTTVSAKYGTSTAITITAATLASGSARGCAAIDNTTNLFLDAALTLLIGVGTVSGTNPGINVWLGGENDGTDYTDNYAGTDAAVTLRSPNNLRGPFFLATPTSTVTYNLIIPSFVQIFGGLVLPPKWGLVVDNETGAAFTSLSAAYTGIGLTDA